MFCILSPAWIKLFLFLVPRYFRRYWLVPDVPGLFVEEYEDASLTDDMLRVRVPQKTGPSPDPNTASGRSTPGTHSDGSAITNVQASTPFVCLSPLQGTYCSPVNVKKLSGHQAGLSGCLRTSTSSGTFPASKVTGTAGGSVNGCAHTRTPFLSSSFNKPLTQGKHHRYLLQGGEARVTSASLDQLQQLKLARSLVCAGYEGLIRTLATSLSYRLPRACRTDWS